MKALVLAGGRGARLGEMSEARNKCMLEVAGRPLIEYSLECAVSAGLSEIVIVVGYRAEEIINAYGNVYKGRVVRGMSQSVAAACPAFPAKAVYFLVVETQKGSRACVTSIAFLAVFSNRLIGAPSRQAWSGTRPMPTTRRFPVGTILWR